MYKGRVIVNNTTLTENMLYLTQYEDKDTRIRYLLEELISTKSFRYQK